MGGSAVDTASSPMGRMMVTMLSGFAEFERALIAERTRGALARKKELGFRTGSARPTAGSCADDWRSLDRKDPERKRLYPDAARAGADQAGARAMGRRPWRKQQGGMSKRKAKGSLRAIAAELDARGIRTRKGKNWLSTQIARLLLAQRSRWRPRHDHHHP